MAVAPSPTAIKTITAAIPITIPKIVNADRALFVNNVKDVSCNKSIYLILTYAPFGVCLYSPDQNISALGSNLIVVIPGSATGVVNQGIGTAQTLTMSNATLLQKQLQYVNGVSPELARHFQITYGSSNTNTNVIGANPIYATVHNVTLNRGSFFTQQQDNSLERVAVFGPGASEVLFGSPYAGVGKQIEINGIIFNVIGVANTKGGTSANSPDNNIYIPLKTAQQYLFGQNQALSSISVSAVNPQSINIVEQEIFNILLAAHGIKNAANADFQLVNQSSIVAILSSTTQTLTALLGSIAGISLFLAISLYISS